jgi:Putative MetA-pathway of phenol degradation
VFNIQKAVSRLPFAPKLKEIQVTDIKKGLGVFTPQPDKPISFIGLQTALKKAGYTLDAAEITVTGNLERDGQTWRLVASPSGQRFALEGQNLERVLSVVAPGDQIEIVGCWKTEGAGGSAREVITPREAKKADGATKVSAMRVTPAFTDGMRFEQASFTPAFARADADSLPPASLALAPIRVTSPGLTVYKGGVVVPRLYLIKQHLGGLEVNRQLLDVSISYTPTQRVQLEAEVPVSRTSFDDGASSGSGAGLGNVTLWGKYRFYRTVKTYGDRQAAARFGLELPTGRRDAPSARQVDAPAFVRQQLSPISGGLSPHFDAAFSQAGGRFIFGGNAEGILRSERAGYRLGHEVRVQTDTEYVLLPRDYPTPGKELFAILETTFLHRGLGRVGGQAVKGSNSTEFYVAPGLQYAAAPRFVVEGSYQFPVVRDTGALVLRTDRSILLGVRYLF